MPEIEERVEAIHGRLLELSIRLRALGYRFADDRKVLPGPLADTAELLGRIETAVGPIPQALRLFYERIGSVDFAGHHPDWHGCEYPDPVLVYPLPIAIDELEEYESDLANNREGFGRFLIPISPDHICKEGVSGGMWYAVEVPNSEDDPQLLYESRKTTFLGYLELGLDWGGFPGLEKSPSHNWPLVGFLV